MMNMEKGEGVAVKGRAIIDSRPPFRSVKEAVALFGERVLVGEVYAKQLKEIETKASVEKEQVSTSAKLGAVSTELEETKENLKKAREQGNYMATSINSLRAELEQAKRELRHLKCTKEPLFEIEHSKTIVNSEIEELKIAEINSPTSKTRLDQSISTINDQRIHLHNELQKKKFVTFASPPSLTREIKHSISPADNEARLGRTPSFKKEGKKKPVIPIIGWLFPRKSKSSNEVSSRSPKT